MSPEAARTGTSTTRDQILDAALAVVERDGMSAATTKRIAAEARLSEGSLYNHFADKADLLVAVVLERLPSIRAAFTALGAEETPLPDRLHAALVAMIAFYSRTQPIVGGILADPALLDRCRARFRETGFGPQSAHQKLAAIIAGEQQAGRVRAALPPATLAAIIIGAATEYASIVRLTGVAPGELEPAAYARSVVATLQPLLAAGLGAAASADRATSSN
jgi:AcrR family transcriptional regulator